MKGDVNKTTQLKKLFFAEGLELWRIGSVVTPVDTVERIFLILFIVAAVFIVAMIVLVVYLVIRGSE